MEINRLRVLYFSPTGGTHRIADFIGHELGTRMNLRPQFINFTVPENRRREYQFAPDELLLVAIPVYAGRVPNKLLPDLRTRLQGNGTPALAISVFGNRSPDEAPRELTLLMEENGFCVMGAAAFISSHAFSDRIGSGRPDEVDDCHMAAFAERVVSKLAGPNPLPLNLDRSEIGPYYVPLRLDGVPAKFLTAKPVTNWDRCIQCGLCAEVCPMGSITTETLGCEGICVKCQACVRHCPVCAKNFEDVDFLSHVAMLEQNYVRRAEPIVIL